MKKLILALLATTLLSCCGHIDPAQPVIPPGTATPEPAYSKTQNPNICLGAQCFEGGH